MFSVNPTPLHRQCSSRKFHRHHQGPSEKNISNRCALGKRHLFVCLFPSSVIEILNVHFGYLMGLPIKSELLVIWKEELKHPRDAVFSWKSYVSSWVARWLRWHLARAFTHSIPRCYAVLVSCADCILTTAAFIRGQQKQPKDILIIRPEERGLAVTGAIQTPVQPPAPSSIHPTEPGGEPSERPRRWPRGVAVTWWQPCLSDLPPPSSTGLMAWPLAGWGRGACTSHSVLCERVRILATPSAFPDRDKSFSVLWTVSIQTAAFSAKALISTFQAGTLTWWPLNLTQDPFPLWRNWGPTCKVWVALPPLFPAWGQPRFLEHRVRTIPPPPSTCQRHKELVYAVRSRVTNSSKYMFLKVLGGECGCGVCNL